MREDPLQLERRPELVGAPLVVGLSGWMDGGDASTGTIEYLVEKLEAEPIGSIAPDPFYIYNFPGSMEISALFRPACRIEAGLLESFEEPENRLYGAPAGPLLLFTGKEPNLRWSGFADALWRAMEAYEVPALWFVGSFAGLVPHSREPRIFTSVSDASLKPRLEACGIRFSDYSGPASFATYLNRQAADRGFPMASLVAELPAYVQGRNPRAIEAIVKRLAVVLDLTINVDDLRLLGNALEERLNEVVASKPELAEQVRKLEADYDAEVFDTQMGDLQAWLEDQGIRLD
jgi:predicted ATP-grasp superfamily ATP-dependent carboligase